MMKHLFITAVMLLTTTGIFAQKMSADEVKSFKAVVLPVTAANPAPAIKKWTRPIYYKIYGSEDEDFDQAVERSAHFTFEQLSELTGLEIKKADADEKPNFKIIIGRPEKADADLMPDALAYAQGRKGNQTFYTNADDSINQMVIILDPAYSDRTTVRNTAKILIVYGMGFFGKLAITNSSVFSARPDALPFNLKPEDTERIQLMYNPKIKFGMKEAEVDAVLAELK